MDRELSTTFNKSNDTLNDSESQSEPSETPTIAMFPLITGGVVKSVYVAKKRLKSFRTLP